MADSTSKNKDNGVLLKVLTAHYHSLVSARSDETILKQFSNLLRFLKRQDADFLETSISKKHESSRLPVLTPEELRGASLDDLDKLVNADETTRKDLEFIAIERFSVPRGSMRSFSNKEMLVEKLRALISNERAHDTIGAIARSRCLAQKSLLITRSAKETRDTAIITLTWTLSAHSLNWMILKLISLPLPTAMQIFQIGKREPYWLIGSIKLKPRVVTIK
jgi:hypothetical protein